VGQQDYTRLANDVCLPKNLASSINNMDTSTLSIRGVNATKATPRVDLDVFFEASQNPYDAQSNPEGSFLLNMAENRHCWNLLRDRIQKISTEEQIPAWVAGYTAVTGAPEVRASVAHFMETFLTGVPIDSEHLALSAGATSVIEMTSFILGNPGDKVVFPAPAYPVYKQDVGNLAGQERYDLQTHTDIEGLRAGIELSDHLLQATYDDFQEKGHRWSILVLTQPDNPTGILYAGKDLVRIAQWCMARKVHLIVNEIYGLSMIDVNHPELCSDYSDIQPFVSFAQIMAELDSDYLHLWYAFSKDFGISGFRMGVLYTLNQELLRAYGNLALGRCVSNHTQWILQQILSDHDFVQKYIETNQRRITASYLSVIKTLRRIQIPYVPARGSLFVWADFSAHLSSEEDAEYKLWMEIYAGTGILLTPGAGFGHNYQGAFRIVHSLVSLQAMDIAMLKLERFLSSRNVG